MQLPTKKRSKPYFWATSISNLLGEAKQCKYSVWLSANYEFEKLSSDSNFYAHDEMVKNRAKQYRVQGVKVYVEQQNSFHIPGKIATVGGRPDLVVLESDRIIIEDCKSGKRKNAHRFQVLIYMLIYRFSPMGKQLCSDRVPTGRLVYSDEAIDISATELDEQFKNSFSQMISMLCAPTQPAKIPSFYECKYCNIPDRFCSERKAIKDQIQNHDLY